MTCLPMSSGLMSLFYHLPPPTSPHPKVAAVCRNRYQANLDTPSNFLKKGCLTIPLGCLLSFHTLSRRKGLLTAKLPPTTQIRVPWQIWAFHTIYINHASRTHLHVSLNCKCRFVIMKANVQWLFYNLLGGCIRYREVC